MSREDLALSAPLGADLCDLLPRVDLVADERQSRGQLGRVEAAEAQLSPNDSSIPVS
jgi:hypothetical protein